MARDIDLSLLRAFVAVKETGGMTQAGRQLNLTQAAVSQQIKRLEEQFGVDLFDRGQRQLTLTSHGERLSAHAERILAFNDEIWGLMTSPGFEGEVRLGVPHDIVGPFMPQILRVFAKSWPRVHVKLNCSTTPELLSALERGELDVALTTEPDRTKSGELLLADRLVWVGGPDGDAHTRDPLPVTLGDESCAFRPAAVQVLSKSGRDWRFIGAIGDMGALCATVEADMAVAPLLSQTVPDGLVVLGGDSGLPALPTYFINLYLRTADAGEIATELAEHIRRSFWLRYPQAA